MKVYTKTGDEGQSSLYDGTRVNKDNAIFGVIGAIDELNAAIGVTYAINCEKSSNPAVQKQLEYLMARLFDLGSFVATPLKEPLKMSWVEQYELLEKWIDEWDLRLPKLTNFILPSGTVESAHLHQARTICRRVERMYIRLIRGTDEPASPSLNDGVLSVSISADSKTMFIEKHPSNNTSINVGLSACYSEKRNYRFFQQSAIKIFLNRLSDYLFTAARVLTCIEYPDLEIVYSGLKEHSGKETNGSSSYNSCPCGGVMEPSDIQNTYICSDPTCDSVVRYN